MAPYLCVWLASESFRSSSTSVNEDSNKLTKLLQMNLPITAIKSYKSLLFVSDQENYC